MSEAGEAPDRSKPDPKHLPDAPVPWQRSDARPMRPAEEADKRDEREHEPEEALTAPDAGPAPG